MDDYMFRAHVESCRKVVESTSYVEILNYSDPSLNSNEEHPLTFDEFDNFLNRRGAFEPRKLPEGVTQINGMRVILQQQAKHPETFTPHYISFTANQYESMVRTFHLPFRAIEGTSVVGPFFWSAYDQDDDNPHLQIIFRKSDVRKKGKTRGWELMLSHEFSTGMTTGFAKGTESSDMVEAVRHLRACAAQVAHPMLLPVIILSHDLSSKNDQKQRDARDWLRKLEHAVSYRTNIREEEGYIKNEKFDVDQINRDLVECHSQSLWKRPQAYIEIIKEMEKGMRRFKDKLPKDKLPKEKQSKDIRYVEVDKLHRSMVGRLEFYRAKLKGIENYVHTTLSRLDLQRSALYNIIAQKDTKLNLEMAGQQRRLAHAAKRDSQSMKTLSLLGAIFLPATYLASIFSMTFFNFNDNNPNIIINNGANGTLGPDSITLSSDDDSPIVAPTLWIYFVFMIPLTLAVVLCWRWWDKHREKKFAEEDVDIQTGINDMEAQIMQSMRQRTLSTKRTWDLGKVE